MQYTYPYPIPFQQYSHMPLMFLPPTAFRRHQQYLQIGLFDDVQVQDLMKRQDIQSIENFLKIISKRILNQQWFNQQSKSNKIKLVKLLQYINKYIKHSKNERVQYLQDLKQQNQDKQKQLKNRKKMIERRKETLYSLKEEYNIKKQAIKEYRVTLERLPKCKICKKSYKNLQRHNDNYHFIESKEEKKNEDSNILMMKEIFLKNQQMLQRLIQKQQLQNNSNNLNKTDQKIYQTKLIEMKQEIDRLKGKISELELSKSKKQSHTSSGLTDQPKLARKITKKYDMDNSDRSKSRVQNNSDYLSRPPVIHDRNDDLMLSPIKDENQDNIRSTIKIKESNGEIKQSAQIHNLSDGRHIKRQLSSNSNKHINELYNSSAKIPDYLMESDNMAPMINILASQKIESGIRSKVQNQNKFDFEEIGFQSKVSKEIKEKSNQSNLKNGKDKNVKNRKISEETFEMMDEIGQNSTYRSNQKKNQNSKQNSKIPKEDDKRSKKEYISKILQNQSEDEEMQINYLREDSRKSSENNTTTRNNKNMSYNRSKNSRKSEDEIKSQDKFNLGVENLGQESKVVPRGNNRVTSPKSKIRKMSQQHKTLKIPPSNIEQGPQIEIVSSITNVHPQEEYGDDFQQQEDDQMNAFKNLSPESKFEGHSRAKYKSKELSRVKSQQSSEDEIISKIAGTNPLSSMKQIANINEKYPPNKIFSDDDNQTSIKYAEVGDEVDILQSVELDKPKMQRFPQTQDQIIQSKKQMYKPPQKLKDSGKLDNNKKGDIRKVVSPKIGKKTKQEDNEEQSEQGFPQIQELRSRLPINTLKKSSKKDMFPDIDSLQSRINIKKNKNNEETNSFRQIQSVQSQQNIQEQINQSILDDSQDAQIENKPAAKKLQQQYEKIKKIKNEKITLNQKEKEQMKKQLNELQKFLAEQHKTIFGKDPSTSKIQQKKTIELDIQKISTIIIKKQQQQISDLKKKNEENQKKKKILLENSLQMSKSYAMNESIQFQLQKQKDKGKKEIEIIKEEPKKEADTSHLSKYGKSKNNTNSFNSKSQNRKQQMNFQDKDQPLQMIQSQDFFKKQASNDSF